MGKSECKIWYVKRKGKKNSARSIENAANFYELTFSTLSVILELLIFCGSWGESISWSHALKLRGNYDSSSVLFKISLCLGKCICAPPHHSEVSPALPLKQIQCRSDSWCPPPPPFFFSFTKNTSGYFLYSSPLQVISGMLSLALCLQVMSQVPQHLRSCKMQAICDGYFAHQSVCLVVSLDLGMCRTVHLHEFSIVSIEHTSVGFLFYFLL